MKIFIGLAFFVIAASALNQELVEQIKQKMKAKMETCATEVSASANDIADILSHKVPATHEGKCVFFCMHKTFNAQNEDGSLNMPGALSNLEMLKDLDSDMYEKVSTAFKNCESTPVDSDPCIFATSLVECIIREGKALGLEQSMME